MGVSASYARDFFIARGYSAGGAAGIVGNLMQESGGGGTLNTNSRNPGDGRDGSDSIGIAQWNSGRARELKSFAAAQGKDWRDGDVQLAFVDKELVRDHAGIARALKADITPANAAKQFIGFERPKGWNTGGGEIGNRIKYANEVAGKPRGDGINDSGIGVVSDTTGQTSSEGNEIAGGSGSSSGATSTGVPEAIDKQTAAQAAAAAARDAADLASDTAGFDSIKDYAGRFIIVALGLIFVAGGVFLFAKGSPPGRALRKAVAA